MYFYLLVVGSCLIVFFVVSLFTTAVSLWSKAWLVMLSEWGVGGGVAVDSVS